MTGLEIALLAVGCIFMTASFFVSEKLSGKEIDRIAELSDYELKRIIEKGMESASGRIESVVNNKVEEVSERTEIALERESNLKIMAIEEYSGTVIDGMKKTHDEIMFLYSMLNDKHTELTSLTGDLQRLAANIRNLQEGMEQKETVKAAVKTTPEDMLTADIPASAIFAGMDNVIKMDSWKKMTPQADEMTDLPDETENNNDRILALYKEGLNKVEIAKRLGLGVGEVSLVIGLYKGEK